MDKSGRNAGEGWRFGGFDLLVVLERTLAGFVGLVVVFIVFFSIVALGTKTNNTNTAFVVVLQSRHEGVEVVYFVVYGQAIVSFERVLRKLVESFIVGL